MSPIEPRRIVVASSWRNSVQPQIVDSLRAAGHALRLLREVVELCVATGANDSEIIEHASAEIAKAARRDEFGGTADSVPQEWADCAILVDIFARHVGIDASAEIRKKIALLREREWNPARVVRSTGRCRRSRRWRDERSAGGRHFHFLSEIEGSAKVSFTGHTPKAAPGQEPSLEPLKP